MDLSALGFTSALDLAASIRRKELSPVEVVDGVLARIEQLDPPSTPSRRCWRMMLAPPRSGPRRQSRAATTSGRSTACGSASSMNVTGAKVTFGTHLLADYVATEDAPVVANLRKAGAIVVGMTTMPEFGWNGISWSPLYGMTRNPWNLEHSASGSSSGSGAAVAAGIVPLAVGSDGAGWNPHPRLASAASWGSSRPMSRVAMFPVSVSELITTAR